MCIVDEVEHKALALKDLSGIWARRDRGSVWVGPNAKAFLEDAKFLFKPEGPYGFGNWATRNKAEAVRVAVAQRAPLADVSYAGATNPGIADGFEK